MKTGTPTKLRSDSLFRSGCLLFIACCLSAASALGQPVTAMGASDFSGVWTWNMKAGDNPVQPLNEAARKFCLLLRAARMTSCPIARRRLPSLRPRNPEPPVISIFSIV